MKYLRQEFDSKVLYLNKHKGLKDCYPYEYMSGFEKSKTESPIKKSFIVCWWVKKLVIKNMSMSFEMKTVKDYHDLQLQCHVLLLADVFEKLRNSSQL